MSDEGVRVALERGAKWTFASALDWPGWCRRGKGDEAALAELDSYRDRYAGVAARAGLTLPPGPLSVVSRLPGTATTDFGAPDARAPEDSEPVGPGDGERLATLLAASWAELDEVAAAAPAELRKGPRGGGRDRDEVVAHVRESERNYTRAIGVRVPPRTPWTEQRAAILAGVRDATGGGSWPLRYYVRRSAWHVLDHAWEIQDKS